MKNNQKTIEKTARFLKELYDTCKKGDQISVAELIIKHHLTTRVSGAIQKLHIIEKIARGRGHQNPVWKVGEPNLKMAANVVAQCQKIKSNEVSVKRSPNNSNEDKLFTSSEMELTQKMMGLAQRIDSLERKMNLIMDFFSEKPKAKKRYKLQWPIVFRKPIIRKP